MGIKKKIDQICFKPFDIDKKELAEFCRLNSQLWNKDGATKVEPSQNDKGYIWIGMFMVEYWMSWMQPKFLHAKGLQEKYGCQPIVVDWEENPELQELYRSYGISFVSLKRKMFSNISGAIYGLLMAIKTMITTKTGIQLSKLKYKDRQIGNYIYDTVIRTYKDVYTVPTARSKACFRKVFTTYWLLDSLEKVAKKYPPKFYLFDDIVYDEGMIIHTMHRHGARVMKGALNVIYWELPESKKPHYWPDIYHKAIEDGLKVMSEETKREHIQKSEDKITQRFLGKNSAGNDGKAAFTNKKECSVEELKEIMGLDPNKKTIVIFSHCLSESPHKCSLQLYEDSYSWITDTCSKVRDIDNVNWVLKAHPVAASKYHEEGVIEKIYEQYKSPNLHLFPDEYNSALVRELADGIVTIYGTAGLEYACLGIPVVNTGSATYTGFGYTTLCKTKEEYYDILQHMDQLKELNEDQIQIAKLIFSYYNDVRFGEYDSYDDDMKKLYSDIFNTYCAHEDVSDANTKALQFIKEYTKGHDMKDTVYYKFGLKD